MMGAEMMQVPLVLQWGWFLITVPNLVVILAMVAVFVIAILAPFPHGGSEGSPGPSVDGDATKAAR